MMHQMNLIELAAVLRDHRELRNKSVLFVESRLPAAPADLEHSWHPSSSRRGSLWRFEQLAQAQGRNVIDLDESGLNLIARLATAYSIPRALLLSLGVDPQAEVMSKSMISCSLGTGSITGAFDRIDRQLFVPRFRLEDANLSFVRWIFKALPTAEVQASSCRDSTQRRTVNSSGLHGDEYVYTWMNAETRETNPLAVRKQFSDLDLGHRGDELAFVRRGAVRVRFENSGISFVVKEGGYCHFYSENPHCIECETSHDGSQEAEVYVLRFYQTKPMGTRLRAITKALHLLNRLRTKPKTRTEWISDHDRHELRSLIIPFLQQSNFPWIEGRAPTSGLPEQSQDAPVESGDEKSLRLHDMAGLFWLLKEHERTFWRQSVHDEKNAGPKPLIVRRSSQYPPAGYKPFLDLAELGERSSAESLLGRTALYRILTCDSPPELSSVDLPKIAEVFGVEQRLLYPYFSPTNPQCVVVEPDDMFVWPASSPDSTKIEPKYSMPRRRLAGSDAVVSIVELPECGETRPNQHTGYELVIVLEGMIELRFHDTKDAAPSSASPLRSPGFFHYHATTIHSIRAIKEKNLNPSGTAKVMVIRSFESHPEETD